MIDIAIESLETHIKYDKTVMHTGTINISMAEAENILKLLKEQEEEGKHGCSKKDLASVPSSEGVPPRQVETRQRTLPDQSVRKGGIQEDLWQIIFHSVPGCGRNCSVVE